jgi:hypothetical protein
VHTDKHLPDDFPPVAPSVSQITSRGIEVTSHRQAITMESTSPPQSVMEFYNEILPFIESWMNMPTPTLYRINKTFWFPRREAFFSPAHKRDPAFFFWDPSPLVVGGVRCPRRLLSGGTCDIRLSKIGVEPPVDLDSQAAGLFYVIGIRYHCPVHLSIASNDPMLLEVLPQDLRSAYPDKLDEEQRRLLTMTSTKVSPSIFSMEP